MSRDLPDGIEYTAERLARAVEALVEEQRTANLLAVLTAKHADGSAMFPGVCASASVRSGLLDALGLNR